MSATPVIPGHVYRVKYADMAFCILADNPCTAILNALEIIHV